MASKMTILQLAVVSLLTACGDPAGDVYKNFTFTILVEGEAPLFGVNGLFEGESGVSSYDGKIMLKMPAYKDGSSVSPTFNRPGFGFEVISVNKTSSTSRTVRAWITDESVARLQFRTKITLSDGTYVVGAAVMLYEWIDTASESVSKANKGVLVIDGRTDGEGKVVLSDLITTSFFYQ